MKYQKKKLTYKIVAGTLLGFIGIQGFSQEHIIQRPEHKWLRLAEEQYRNGHYQLALQSAGQYLAQSPGNVPVTVEEEREKARYFQTMSRLKLDNDGAEDSAKFFLHIAFNPAYKQRISLALAQFYFRHEQLSDAIPFYETASIVNLTNTEIADSKFELAYAYFNSRRFDKAEPLFASIKEVPGKYYLAGNYYYGLLAYNNGRYEDALTSFKRIDNEPQYQNIVPYYIAELYYFKGERKKALEEAIRLTRRKEKLFYDNELHLLAAQVLFEDQRYGDALPYFEHYYQNTDKIRKEELYEMGYSYYRVNEWKNAIEKFKPLSSAQDSLGQTAMYLLGDCYLKINEKKSARNAFSICADMPYNRGQQEASFLLYGKLSYDMGYNDDALRSFTTLVETFPQSQHTGEAKTYLSDLLIKTNRYAEAYTALKDVQNKTGDYWNVWQRVTYGYGLQQMRNGDLGNAYLLLTASLERPVDEAYEAAALFWRGDIAHRQNKPADVLANLRQFLNKADNRKLRSLSPNATAANAYLNMGYAAMEAGSYNSAQTYFAKARQSVTHDSPIAINASVREADAAFMQKNYKEALALYDKIIAANAGEADYAQLQKGILMGVSGKPLEKVSLLEQLVYRNPPSRYSNDARYELGTTLIEDGKYQKAITILQPLTTHPEARHLASKAWMKIGFAYQEQNNVEESILAYKKVVTLFPAGEDRTAALHALHSLYIETNQPESYALLLRDNNLPDAGTESMDSTYYAAAEAQVAAGKWNNAKSSLRNYLDKYPNGLFTTHARYYKAESHFQLKEHEAALGEYDILLALPWNEFSEASAKRAADIAYKTSNYPKAMNYYAVLRNHAMSPENLQLAYSGMMRSAYNHNEYEQATLYADTLLTMQDLSETVMNEVQFFKALSLQRSNKKEEALSIYRQLQDVTNENVAAEARYRIAELYFAQNNLKDAEAAAAEVLKLNTGNEYWTVKSYLLIAEILIKQKDYFNAKATLQSLVKNTKNTQLKKDAVQKLEEVKRLEKQNTKLRD